MVTSQRELKYDEAAEAQHEIVIRALRIKWGFCPGCGLNLNHPVNAYYHRDNVCEVDYSSRNPAIIKGNNKLPGIRYDK